MIIKAVFSKTGSLGSCFVCMDLYSNEQLAMQNLQIPNTAETRNIPKWLFLPRFSDKNKFTSSRPDAVLVAPIPARTKKQQTSNEGGWVLRSGRGQMGETTGSISAAPPAISRSTFPRQHQGPKDLSILQCDIHLIEIKYCEEIRPQNQPCAAQEQHKGLCTFLQDLPLPSTPSYWERVGGTI